MKDPKRIELSAPQADELPQRLDVFMSLIHTCRINGVNAFEYLHAIAQHAQRVAAAPKQWLPWNYRDQLPRCASP